MIWLLIWLVVALVTLLICHDDLVDIGQMGGPLLFLLYLLAIVVFPPYPLWCHFARRT